MASLLSTAVVVAQDPVPPTTAKRPKDAAALLGAFAKMPGLEARYTEEKHLSLLAVPLKSKGRLYFMQPGYLSRVVEAPEKSKLTITPDELRMVDRDGVEVIDLHKSDRLRLFVTSLVRVFRGEQKSLGQLYRVVYKQDSKNETDWTLVLTPRGKPLDQMMKSLTLRGRGVSVTELEVAEPNGDRTVTRILAADPKRKFSVVQQAEIFGIERRAGPAKKAP